MHICFVEKGYPIYSDHPGGAGTYVRIFSKELVRRGHHVSVVCSKVNTDDEMINDGLINIYPTKQYAPIHYYISKIPILKIFSKLVRYLEIGLNTYKVLIRINAKKKIDIVEYSEGGDFWNSLTRKFDYVTHLHGSSYTFKNNSGFNNVYLSDKLQRKAEHYFIKKSSVVFSPCEAMIKIVQSESGFIFKKKYVLPYPLEDQELENVVIDSSKKKQKAIKLIFASRNDPVKGGELLIDALRKLPKKIIANIEVNFFGYEPKQDISNLKFLNINKFILREELLNEYKRSDICLIPSIFDNSPNTVYEAMANGKVVIASDVGGIPELINNKKNGFLFKNRSADNLAETIIKSIRLIKFGNSNKLRNNAKKSIFSISSLRYNTRQRLSVINKIIY